MSPETAAMVFARDSSVTIRAGFENSRQCLISSVPQALSIGTQAAPSLATEKTDTASESELG